MDNEHDGEQLTAEELAAEKEALQEVEGDDLRENLAEEMGLDPEEHSELLDRIVKREQENRQRLSGAIKQKIKWRDQVRGLSKNPGKQEGKSQKVEAQDIEQLAESKVKEILETRDLEALDLSDELKEEVKRVAKMNGVSVRDAAKDPYIQFKREQIEKDERLKAATPTRKKNGSAVRSVDPAKPLNPTDFEMSTPEGAKAWKEARAARNKWMAENQ